MLCRVLCPPAFHPLKFHRSRDRRYLPLREENPRLPAFLRVLDKDNESPLPKGSLYLDQVGDEPLWS